MESDKKQENFNFNILLRAIKKTLTTQERQRLIAFFDAWLKLRDESGLRTDVKKLQSNSSRFISMEHLTDERKPMHYYLAIYFIQAFS